MKILCIQDGHNASASLMINGKIIFALQEERFNEIKNYTGYPYQSVQYCLNFLKKEKLNLDGGAIALGHPLGATGARITGKAAEILRRENKKYALATQCIGLGMGIATIIETTN